MVDINRFLSLNGLDDWKQLVRGRELWLIDWSEMISVVCVVGVRLLRKTLKKGNGSHNLLLDMIT